jgi:Calcineurin-like phosphoesterase
MHFNKRIQFKWPDRTPLLQVLRNAIVEHHDKVGVDLIVVTGDVSDNPISLSNNQHKQVLMDSKDYLEEVCEACKLNPKERLLVVPGNHDYKLSGNLFSRSSKQHFSEVFADHFSHRVFEWGDKRIVIGCFDSNGKNGRYELALGYVDRQQFDTFKSLCSDDQLQRDCEIRIAAVHHSPMPVPRAENFKVSLLEKFLGGKMVGPSEFLHLRNAGSFLHELIQANISFVFHGHLHEHGYWRVHSRSRQDTPGGWVEVFSGAALNASSPKPHHFFGTIRVDRDGSVFASQHELSAEGGPVQSHRLPSAPYEDIRLAKANAKAAASNVECELFSKSWEIDVTTGSMECIKIMKGLRATGDLKISRVIIPTGGNGLIASVLRAYDMNDMSEIPIIQAPLLDSNQQPVLDHSKAPILARYLEFNPPLEKTPKDIVCTCEYNGGLFRSEQDQDDFGVPNANDKNRIGFKTHWPIQRLLVKLKFVSDEKGSNNEKVKPPRRLDLIATDATGETSYREVTGGHCSMDYWSPERLGKLNRKTSEPECLFTVHRPAVDTTYSLEWALPKHENINEQYKAPLNRLRSAIQKKDSQWPTEIAHRGLELLSTLLASRHQLDDGDKNNVKNQIICLFFGRAQQKKPILTCLGHTVVGFNNLTQLAVRYGHGAIGRAFRLATIANEHRNVLIKPDDAHESVQFFFACPIIWRKCPLHPIGVIVFASDPLGPLQLLMGAEDSVDSGTRDAVKAITEDLLEFGDRLSDEILAKNIK